MQTAVFRRFRVPDQRREAPARRPWIWWPSRGRSSARWFRSLATGTWGRPLSAFAWSRWPGWSCCSWKRAPAKNNRQWKRGIKSGTFVVCHAAGLCVLSRFWVNVRVADSHYKLIYLIPADRSSQMHYLEPFVPMRHRLTVAVHSLEWRMARKRKNHFYFNCASKVIYRLALQLDIHQSQWTITRLSGRRESHNKWF